MLSDFCRGCGFVLNIGGDEICTYPNGCERESREDEEVTGSRSSSSEIPPELLGDIISGLLED